MAHGTSPAHDRQPTLTGRVDEKNAGSRYAACPPRPSRAVLRAANCCTASTTVKGHYVARDDCGVRERTPFLCLPNSPSEATPEPLTSVPPVHFGVCRRTAWEKLGGCHEVLTSDKVGVPGVWSANSSGRSDRVLHYGRLRVDRLERMTGQWIAYVKNAVQGQLLVDDEQGEFFVSRHGEGRKYWGLVYPDGTYTHNALTQAEAKKQAENWVPDATLVTLELGGQDDLTNPTSVSQDALPVAIANDQEPLTVELVIAGYLADAEPFKAESRSYYAQLGDEQKSALSNLHALAALRRAVEERIREEVYAARRNTGTSQWYTNNATWEQVGKALGVSKQSAQGRYGG